MSAEPPVDDDPGDAGSSQNVAERELLAAGATQRGSAGAVLRRVTLQFAGAPLALPADESSTPADDAPAAEPLLESAARIASTASDVPASNDAWGRLRESGPAPARPRIVTPPLTTRADALDLVGRVSRPPSTPGLDLGREMSDRYALGDYTGALRVAELLLGRNPRDRKAQRCADGSRERLMQLYGARLGSLCATEVDLVGELVPSVAVPEHEIRWLGLDHRQGFLLSRLDGRATLDDLVDLSGMSRLEVLRTMVELIEARAITFG